MRVAMPEQGVFSLALVELNITGNYSTITPIEYTESPPVRTQSAYDHVSSTFYYPFPRYVYPDQINTNIFAISGVFTSKPQYTPSII